MRQGYSRAEYMHSWQQRKTDQQTIIGGANSFFKSYPLEDQLGRACPYELSKAWVGSSSVLPGLNATTRNGVEEDNKGIFPSVQRSYLLSPYHRAREVVASRPRRRKLSTDMRLLKVEELQGLGSLLPAGWLPPPPCGHSTHVPAIGTLRRRQRQ